MTSDLFDEVAPVAPWSRALTPGAVVLHGFATRVAADLLSDLQRIVADAPFRHLITPGGRRMSVAMTNCGPLGWVSDKSGYCYSDIDPQSGRPWPPLPASFLQVATDAAAAAGFGAFAPDACLVNRYEPGARLSLHQDRDERDVDAPIVSVSLGLPATFLFGGAKRADPTMRVPLTHGDVAVWGGPARLRYHGVLPVADGLHAAAGRYRFNLTFRKAR